MHWMKNIWQVRLRSSCSISALQGTFALPQWEILLLMTFNHVAALSCSLITCLLAHLNAITCRSSELWSVETPYNTQCAYRNSTNTISSIYIAESLPILLYFLPDMDIPIIFLSFTITLASRVSVNAYLAVQERQSRS